MFDGNLRWRLSPDYRDSVRMLRYTFFVLALAKGSRAIGMSFDHVEESIASGRIPMGQYIYCSGSIRGRLSRLLAISLHFTSRFTFHAFCGHLLAVWKFVRSLCHHIGTIPSSTSLTWSASRAVPI
jgi:hypothetical protein